MVRTGHVCDACGNPASVHILERYVNGQPLVRHVCVACADRSEEGVTSGPASSFRRFDLPWILVLMGISVGVVATLADRIEMGPGGGFGWYHLAGLGLGGLLVVIGAMVGVDVVAILGTLLVIVTVCGDHMGLVGASADFGWKQQAAFLATAALVVAGLLARRRKY
jgi:hypothetical protein